MKNNRNIGILSKQTFQISKSAALPVLILTAHLVDALVDRLGEVGGLLDALVRVHEDLATVVERDLLPRPNLGAAVRALVSLKLGIKYFVILPFLEIEPRPLQCLTQKNWYIFNYCLSY